MGAMELGDASADWWGSNFNGIIIASYSENAVFGETGGADTVGGLVGRNFSVGAGSSPSLIIASYATGNVDGGTGTIDHTGGLVGANLTWLAQNRGEITASYATGNVSDAGGANDRLGGLVGWNGGGKITASYAIGDITDVGGAGEENNIIGGLVGQNCKLISGECRANPSNTNYGEIIASYATGDAIGSDGDNDLGGVLVGMFTGGNSPNVSYGFGDVSGAETINLEGDPPALVVTAEQLSAENAGARWNTAADDTLGAWDFGNAMQTPALRYADYDGSGNNYSCDLFPATLPNEGALTCGSTLLPNQRR